MCEQVIMYYNGAAQCFGAWLASNRNASTEEWRRGGLGQTTVCKHRNDDPIYHGTNLYFLGAEFPVKLRDGSRNKGDNVGVVTLVLFVVSNHCHQNMTADPFLIGYRCRVYSMKYAHGLVDVMFCWGDISSRVWTCVIHLSTCFKIASLALGHFMFVLVLVKWLWRTWVMCMLVLVLVRYPWRTWVIVWLCLCFWNSSDEHGSLYACACAYEIAMTNMGHCMLVLVK